MKSFSSRLIPVAVASVLCGVALAGGGKDDHMKMMDKNGDGKITAAEYADGSKEMFSKMDANKDGSVTAQEMDAMHASMMKDKGHATARTESGPTEDKMADKKAYDPSGTGKSMPKMMSSEEKIAKLDTNNDGKLSQAEYMAGSKERFSKMDKDGDGTLTAQEMRDGERAMMASDE
ncbi:EF-hand domain-containing protein [Peristeroidobacter soli]|uniref:EF-hand domain-containing protein n=1 Tax=Peristeroidobacter soli TaxID=2497877 RepID=UPI00101C607D|nr:EF-hand domain-containing protein [Peristeroidobacter soli]